MKFDLPLIKIDIDPFTDTKRWIGKKTCCPRKKIIKRRKKSRPQDIKCPWTRKPPQFDLILIYTLLEIYFSGKPIKQFNRTIYIIKTMMKCDLKVFTWDISKNYLAFFTAQKESIRHENIDNFQKTGDMTLTGISHVKLEPIRILIKHFELST